MKNKQSKLREVREEIGVKGRVIINIYLSILPLLPSLPSIIPSRVRGIFLYDTHNYKLFTLHPICFFKGRKGRAPFSSLIAIDFPLPLGLNFKGRVREEWREEI